MKKIVSILLVSMVLMMGLTGCSTAKSKEEVTLNVSAAASLTDCMKELERLYKEQAPNVKFQFNYGSSGALVQQIEQGAPADLFISAGEKQMNALEKENYLQTDTREDLLKNALVLIGEKDSTQKITFETLAEADKIAAGEPESVPAGQYAAEVFESLGETDVLKNKLVYAKDVREVLSWVETGNAPVGIVYQTDAKISDKVQILDTASEESHKPILYPAAVLKSTKYLKEAQDFMSFLKTNEAKAVFEKYGFITQY